MSKPLPVAGGFTAIVDDDVYEWASKFKWYMANGYARRRDYPSKRPLYLHRLVMGDPPGLEIDHLHHNKLDCRRAELRACTHQQNQQARGKQHQNPTSVYKGVGWYATARKWRARIKVNGQESYLGLFNNEIDAARAYDKAAKSKFGEFADTNF